MTISVTYNNRSWVWIAKRNGRYAGRPVWFGMKNGREVMMGQRAYRAFLKELMPMRISYRLERGC